MAVAFIPNRPESPESIALQDASGLSVLTVSKTETWG